MIQNLKNIKLLYAEDEDNIQKYYGQYFSTVVKEVYLAKDGLEAYDIYKQKSPDALILDINMPKLNGIELVKKIRKENRTIPIVLLTARSDLQTYKQAIDLHLTSYIEKPVNRKILSETIEKLASVFSSRIVLFESKIANYTWDKIVEQLYCNNDIIKLTKNEILLLKLLIERKSKCSNQDIYEYVWANNDKEYNDSTIKTLISGLKTKIPKNMIKNQYGMGYYLGKSD